MSGKRVIGFILTFLCIALPFIAWYVAISTCRGHRTIQIKTMKCAAIWSSAGFAITITLLFVSMLLYIMHEADPHMSITLALNSIAAWCYYQGRCFLNYIFVGRLYYCFDGTHMAYSNTLINTMLILITINLISLNFVSVSWYICPDCGFPLFMVNILFDITLPVILSVLFIKKMRTYASFNSAQQLESSTTSTVTTTTNTDDHIEKHMAEVNDQANFGNTVVRSTVLTIFAAMSSWCTAIIIFMLFIDNVSYDPFKFFMWEFVVILDSAVNVLCLCFYFSFSIVLYGVLCGRIHRYCLSIYVIKNQSRARERNNSKHESSKHNEKKIDTPNDQSL
eukprot:97010_1